MMGVETFTPVQKLISRWNDFKMLQRKISASPYRNHYSLSLETERYAIQIAERWDQVTAALALRHQIFTTEIQAPKNPFQLDLDRLDLDCDHLIVTERASGKIVGTYRLLASETCWRFYHQSEFMHSAELLGTRRFLELGRACIHGEHRNGSVLRLLWRGILAYAQLCRAEVLIGCSSVNVHACEDILGVSQYLLARGELTLNTPICPTREFRVPGLTLEKLRVLSPGADANAQWKDKIPPLLKSYLAAGAVIHGEPALDREFQCIDFFTVWNLSAHRSNRLNESTPSHARRSR